MFNFFDHKILNGKLTGNRAQDPRSYPAFSKRIRTPPSKEEEEGILQLEYISFILHLLGSHLQSGPEVGGN